MPYMESILIHQEHFENLKSSQQWLASDDDQNMYILE